MARKKIMKNRIQNVRVVDKDEGADDIVCQRFLQSYQESEGQIRVLCNVRTEISPGSAATSGLVDFSALAGSDDFVSFSAQYLEFRVRAVRFDIYDIQPNAPSTINYWATYHQVGGTPPQTFENIIDRPDSRSVAPGDGKTTLAWVAHGIPEMAFQSVNSYNGLGGLVNYISPSSAVSGTRYTIIAKFVVDFRGRI